MADLTPTAAQVSVLTRLAGAPHGRTLRRLGVRSAVLWPMERAGWVTRGGYSAQNQSWRITDAGRRAIEQAPAPEPTVWRAVGKSQLRSGRGSVLGPDTTRRTRWWELDLDPCGHHVQRTVRYKPSGQPQRGGTQHRTADDVLPAPKKVRCEQCEQLERARQAAVADAAAGPKVTEVAR